MKPKLRTFLTIAAALSLAGCGGEPSENDIHRAVKASFDNTNRHLKRMGGEAFMVAVPEVKKRGCKADGKNAYMCDIEISDKSGKHAELLRMVKAGGEWKFECEACDRMDALLGPLN